MGACTIEVASLQARGRCCVAAPSRLWDDDGRPVACSPKELGAGAWVFLGLRD
jgi:hypothetical protein